MSEEAEPKRIEIRDASVGDFRGVEKVARTTWDHTYKVTIPEDVRRKFVSRAYSAESLRRRVDSNVFLVAVAGLEVHGFADFRTLSDKEAELAAIYVLPEAQRRRIGARLLETGIARFPPGTRVVLRVERDNTRAQRFYETHGFTRAGEYEDEFYGHVIHEVEMVL